jgi:Ca2+-binding RTX toxin-like protein
MRAEIATGWGHDRIVIRGSPEVVGSRHDDTLIGTPTEDYMSGGRGADMMVGGQGEDELDGGRGDDVLKGGENSDSLVGRRGRDTLIGGAGPDGLDGSLGADRLWGGSGSDWFEDALTFADDQVLSGGMGRDEVELDLRALGSVDFTVDMQAGTFTFNSREVQFPFRTIENIGISGVGTARVIGTNGPNSVKSEMALIAVMGAGSDSVRGSRYDDVVDGGEGLDFAQTDLGLDTCISIESLPYDDCETVQ